MAGVFYELIREALKEDGTLAIDIVTGASAGAVTATLATYYLLGVEVLPENAEESLFYKAWVEEVDIQSISAVGKGPEEDEESHILNWSLLSGNAIKDISRKLVGHFVDRIREQLKQETRSSLGPVALLVTITNLQGLLKKTSFPRKSADAEPCAQGDPPDEKIQTVTSAEIRQFLFHSELLRSEGESDQTVQPLTRLGEMWQKADLSCRASGAFPIAFPPVSDRSNVESINLVDLSDDYFLDRDRLVLNEEALGEINAVDQTHPHHLKFQYTDGGVLDGLPILRGLLFEKLLIEEGDISQYFGFSDPNLGPFREEWKRLNLNPDRRLYVYIQPTPSEGLQEIPQLTKGRFSMLEVGLNGLTLPKTEHDAIRLENIRQRNEDFCRKQNLLKALDDLFRQIPDPQKQTFGPIRDRLREEIDNAIPYRYIRLCRIDPSLLADAYENRSENYRTISAALKQYLPAYMRDEAIPNRQIKRLLASDFLGAFGGFFDRRYREHDFLLGRICGQLWLMENCWQVTGQDDPRIQALAALIQTTPKIFLATDPKPSDLSRDQVRILENLIWRTLRILFEESKPGAKAAGDEDNSLIFKLLGRVALKVILLVVLGLGVLATGLSLLVLKLLF
jgi:hypothetical protein